MPTKVCVKCGKEKELEEFPKRSRSKDGRRGECKQCIYAKKDKLAVSKYNLQYRNSHKEETKKYRDTYRILNKRYFLDYSMDYWKKNKEVLLKKGSEYRKTPRGKFSSNVGYHKRRDLLNKYKYTLTLEQWNKIIDLQRNRCIICGKKFTKKNPPTKDHIIPLTKEGNTQATHHSCNSSKGNKIDKSNIVSWVTRPDLCVTMEFPAN